MTASPPLAPREAIPAGLKPVRKRLADGTERIYYFDRKTGKALGSDREKAIEWLRDIRGDAIAPRTLDPRNFEALVAAYKASPEFRDKKPSTRTQYAYELEELLGDLHGVRLADITPAVIYAIRDKVAERGHRHKANSLVRMLRILFSFAKARRLVSSKPTEDVTLVPVSPRTEVWTQQQVDLFLADARPSLKAGMALLLYTVQRLSDVLALTRDNLHENQVDGRLWIGLRQNKTAALVWTPCHSALAEILRALPADQHLLVPSPRGLPWLKRNFARAWDKHLQAVNHTLAREALRATPLCGKRGKVRERTKATIRQQLLSDLQRRDLRRTGMVQMALAGATPSQIAAVSGHSIDQTMKILDTYIPRRGDVAAGAITAWEANRPLGTAFSGPGTRTGNQFPDPGNQKRLRLISA
ncbi:tyrosine-type recombinase/integrase [Teichococcus oryzae]|uniref:Integrase n=1 Tax=Teichococcus oryzae TaxID=1608942 RepID=A0A5B2TC67_9PROT|nr:integrase [Pseudoroseomonas oryzae]KAA2211665.1 integrase [Pseudoroseomonas oryzae]